MAHKYRLLKIKINMRGVCYTKMVHIFSPLHMKQGVTDLNENQEMLYFYISWTFTDTFWVIYRYFGLRFKTFYREVVGIWYIGFISKYKLIFCNCHKLDSFTGKNLLILYLDLISALQKCALKFDFKRLLQTTTTLICIKGIMTPLTGSQFNLWL